MASWILWADHVDAHCVENYFVSYQPQFLDSAGSYTCPCVLTLLLASGRPSLTFQNVSPGINVGASSIFQSQLTSHSNNLERIIKLNKPCVDPNRVSQKPASDLGHAVVRLKIYV